MRKISIFDIMNQRKPLSHLVFLGFSLLFTAIAGYAGIMQGNFNFSFPAFILIFFQLEVFIFFGNILFSRVNFDKNPGEITRIVAVRFAVFIAACLSSAMILFLLLQYSILILMGGDLSKVLPDFIHYGIHEWFRSTISGLSGGAVIFILLLWQASLRREQKLREEKLIFQNETLKNQLNPHFLFNSLNTLSSLVANQPEIAEKFINKLSSIYRYILENSRKDKVSLLTELAFITDYFELHKVRDNGKIVLNIDTPEASEFSIIAVSLQILVENAIKHNMATRESPLIIFIYIEDDRIVVKNNLQRMSSQMGSTGIGLKNLGERARLITGRSLVIEETNNYFTVKVPITR
jgi:sensor histidine kinase YesM